MAGDDPRISNKLIRSPSWLELRQWVIEENNHSHQMNRIPIVAINVLVLINGLLLIGCHGMVAKDYDRESNCVNSAPYFASGRKMLKCRLPSSLDFVCKAGKFGEPREIKLSAFDLLPPDLIFDTFYDVSVSDQNQNHVEGITFAIKNQRVVCIVVNDSCKMGMNSRLMPSGVWINRKGMRVSNLQPLYRKLCGSNACSNEQPLPTHAKQKPKVKPIYDCYLGKDLSQLEAILRKPARCIPLSREQLKDELRQPLLYRLPAADTTVLELQFRRKAGMLYVWLVGNGYNAKAIGDAFVPTSLMY